MRYTVASFNIYKNLTDKTALRQMLTLLKIKRLDVVGLQEIDWTIEAHDLPAGWDAHQMPRRWHGKDPIVWDRRIGEVAVGGEEIVDSVREGGRITPRRGVTWVVFRDFIVVNLHLNADVEARPGHPKSNDRPQANYEAMMKTVAIADLLQERYDKPLLITGDFNVDYGADKRVQHPLFPYVNLTRAGFRCCWDGFKEQSTRRRHPIKGRTIDHVWARGTKTHKVKFRRTHTPNEWASGRRIASDHLPVIVDLDIVRKRYTAWVQKITRFF